MFHSTFRLVMFIRTNMNTNTHILGCIVRRDALAEWKKKEEQYKNNYLTCSSLVSVLIGINDEKA